MSTTTITRYWPNVVASVAAQLGMTESDALAYWRANASLVYVIWTYVVNNPGLQEADIVSIAAAPTVVGQQPSPIAGLDATLIHRALVLGDTVSKLQGNGQVISPIAIAGTT